MRCTICREEHDCKPLALYVNGSEGVDLCTTCEMHVMNFIRTLMNCNSTGYKNGYAACKKNRDAVKEV